MKDRNDRGFSLIELLIVVVVIGIIASIATPHLQKAIRAAEVGNTFATMRTIGSTELTYFTQNGRFARITEVNNIMSGSIGVNSGNEVNRGKFVFAMVPGNVSDVELRSGYTMTATRDVTGEGVRYIFELNQSGQIRQIEP